MCYHWASWPLRRVTKTKSGIKPSYSVVLLIALVQHPCWAFLLSCIVKVRCWTVLWILYWFVVIYSQIRYNFGREHLCSMAHTSPLTCWYSNQETWRLVIRFTAARLELCCWKVSLNCICWMFWLSCCWSVLLNLDVEQGCWMVLLSCVFRLMWTVCNCWSNPSLSGNWELLSIEWHNYYGIFLLFYQLNHE